MSSTGSKQTLPCSPSSGKKMDFFSIFCFLLTLSLIPSPQPACARGGEQNPTFSGLTDNNHGFLVRHLFFNKENQSEKVDIARGYMTNSELEEAVKRFNQRCASISKIYSIGKSVKKIPLWVIEISDKPGQNEAEPEFKFIGNVHGDEPVGRELLIRLSNWLCDNYMKDPLATFIIENIHLHILLSMNPDGFSLMRRGNANNIDLNRDFPDQFFPNNDDEDSRQPETKAVMNWLKRRHFTASASLHGGALVANYPWDGSQNTRKQYYACPDDRAFRYMASVYSHSHYNMSLSNEFKGGITNGALWYPIYGGMQDWNYIHGGCFELTLEISDVKWPKAEELPTLWEFNRMSMLNLVASIAKTGVHGRIFSSDTGQPLPASIMIKGINYTVKAGNILGDYHRMLAPGQSYEVMVSMRGYLPKTTHILLEDEAMNVDFILTPEEEDPNILRKFITGCDCNCDKNKFEFAEFLTRTPLQISLVVILILGFLCFLLRRKLGFKVSKNRQLTVNKRVNVA